MIKKAGINAGIGAAFCAVGGIGWTWSSAPSSHRAGWEVLIIGSAWYAGISAAIGICVGLFHIYKKSTPHVTQVLNDRDKAKAHDELLRLKNLLDQDIITKEEFDAKAHDLKVRIL